MPVSTDYTTSAALTCFVRVDTRGTFGVAAFLIINNPRGATSTSLRNCKHASTCFLSTLGHLLAYLLA